MLDWRQPLTKPQQRSAPGEAAGNLRGFRFSTFKHHLLPQRICFAIQVLLSGLLDNAETTWPFTETQLTSNGRSCLTRTKETEIDGADLRPRKNNVGI